MKLHLDTHAVVWLYTGELKKFPKPLLTKMQEADLFISPAVQFELALLHKIGKARDSEDKVLQTLRREIELKIEDIGSAELFAAACGVNWTKDPFDRLIVAASEIASCPLVTRDLHIHDHYKKALW